MVQRTSPPKNDVTAEIFHFYNFGPGSDRRTRICNSEPCKPPEWGPYEAGECSVTCGGGQLVKIRKCIRGEPGDVGCKGPTRKLRSCNTAPCGTILYFITLTPFLDYV